ncbi:semaphorin-2A-like, partial [Stegodyphus dumicola]|uniref:semaphorin-2A-like n=1 Tax=Stegodyphus dumicola TaxID=202533 RepID=UPI0015ADD610
MLTVMLAWCCVGLAASYRHHPRYPWAPGETRIRHHREHVREFNCGRLFYRTFFLDIRRDVLYVGAMDKVFRLNLANINRTRCE